MTSPTLTMESILQTLETQMTELAEFGGATFEMLEDYFALGDARLSVFRSERLWVVAVEAIGYSNGSEIFSNEIWLYGNAIAFDNSRHSDLSRLVFTTPHLWQTRIHDDGIWQTRREKFSIRRNGKRFDFSPTREELETAGVLLSTREWESGELSPIQVMRYVCHALDHSLFASEDLLRDLIDSKMLQGEFQHDDSGPIFRSWFHTEVGDFEEAPTNCDLELFLQTRHWRHPCFDETRGAVSIREAFEPLAKAIASGDLRHWHEQDESLFNSHWSHWTQTEASLEAAQTEGNLELAEEGRRFRKALENLPEGEREKTLASLKKQWERNQRANERLMKRATELGGLAFTHISSGALDWDGEVYSFGPHLWEETGE